jgi:hypothetical protein
MIAQRDLRRVIHMSLLLWSMGLATFAQGQTLKPHHAKAALVCNVCHGPAADQGRFEPPETSACLTCHGDRAALIKRTTRLNKVVEEKDRSTGKVIKVTKDTNPHSGHHDRGRLDCVECHREHRQSMNLCSLCHDTQRWMKPTP